LQLEAFNLKLLKIITTLKTGLRQGIYSWGERRPVGDRAKETSVCDLSESLAVPGAFPEEPLKTNNLQWPSTTKYVITFPVL
jgi:hypothetical protein